MFEVLVFGRHGQIALQLQKRQSKNAQWLFVGRDTCDIAKPNSATQCLDHYKPKNVILCTAFTKVDQTDTEMPLANQLNVQAPQEISHWCKANHAGLVWFSSDYVFDGTGVKPWTEQDHPQPLNSYGKTKLQGENAIRNSGADHLILRTSWVYSEKGQNFFLTMLRLGKDRKELKVVCDQIGAPNYAGTLADQLIALIPIWNKNRHSLSGTYHFSSSGYCSWYEFAQAIFAKAKQSDMNLNLTHLMPISSHDYASPTIRPLNSRLDTTLVQKTFGISFKNWEEDFNFCWSNYENQ